MKVLNNKGYMTIEIILASVITFAIAFFLIDLTMSLTDVTDNTYEDTVIVTDKSLIIKNLKENIESDMCSNGGINQITCSGNTCTIKMNENSVIRKVTIDDKTLKYTNQSGSIIYTKKLKESYSNIALTTSSQSGYWDIKITGKNIFIDEKYDINVIIYNRTTC